MWYRITIEASKVRSHRPVRPSCLLSSSGLGWRISSGQYKIHSSCSQGCKSRHFHSLILHPAGGGARSVPRPLCQLKMVQMSPMYAVPSHPALLSSHNSTAAYMCLGNVQPTFSTLVGSQVNLLKFSNLFIRDIA